jgi:hypothetical protein
MRIQLYSETIRVKRAVLGFAGWPDAAATIEATMAELRNLIPCELVATWDLDGYWQIGSTRPIVQVRHGQIQTLEWPSYHFLLSRPSTSEPFVVGYGPEPGCNWRSFTGELLQLLQGWGCEELVLVGSLYDQIFHDEIVISAVVQDPKNYNLVRDLGCRQIEYAGPGAVHSAIMEQTKESALHCLGLWAHLPFYLETPHELVMAQCIKVVGKLMGLDLHPLHLVERWREREQEINQLVQNNQQLRQSIDNMRKRRDREDAGDGRKIVRMHDFRKKKQDEPPDEET